MRQLFLIFILLTTLYSCGQTPEKKVSYPLQVGDIYFDSKIDDPDFKICDEDRVFQYYNFGKGLLYKGEKVKINEHFRDGLKTKEQKDESGFLTIRFIVNCEGKTGRYRIQGMNNDYKEKAFNDNLTSQLLSLTKQLNGWIVGEYEGKTYDYYQYLTFKIENGRLIEIMP
jgi:hypothetical protein